MVRLSIVLVLLGLAAPASAATFAVELRGDPAWQATAIATALRLDLADSQLRAAGPGEPVDIVVRGELTLTELRFTIPGIRELIVIERAGVDRAQLAGRLRDELHRLANATEAPPPAAVLDEPTLGVGAIAGLAALLVGLCVPLVFARKAPAAGRPFAWSVVLAIVGVASAGIALATAPEAIASLGSLVFVAGGLAWGIAGAVLLPFAFPPVVHLHRAEHGELVPALLAWGALALQRVAIVVALLVPAGFALAAYADAIALSREIAFGVVAPIAGLVLVVAWRALVEVLARRLDRELADTTADWHPHVRGYYAGYLRRANLEVDEQLLDRVRFVASKTDEVAVYARRIVIPRAMLEHALAPYGRPHDYLQPRVSTLHWTHWNSGLVMPTEAGVKLASMQDRKPQVAVEEGASERIALGEPPTLTGIIEPVALDPRTSYRPGDDPLWLDWDPGEDFDGTDAGDKDYLFGILVHALGIIQRREDRRAAIVRAWGRHVPRAISRVAAPVRAWLARRTTALADLHAALGGARHHLAQYIAWRALRDDDLLTARAYVPELEQKSRAIASAIHPADPRVRERIAQLITSDRPRRRRLVVAVAVGAGVIGIGALAVQAVRYHATYEDRIASQRRSSDGNRP